MLCAIPFFLLLIALYGCSTEQLKEGMPTKTGARSPDVALNHLDFSDCASKSGTDLETCKIKVITYFGDIKHCDVDINTASNPQMISVCKYEWAIHSAEPDTCALLENDFRKNLCIDAFQNNTQPKTDFSQMPVLNPKSFHVRPVKFPNEYNYFFDSYNYSSQVILLDTDGYKLFVNIQAFYTHPPKDNYYINDLKLLSKEGKLIGYFESYAISNGPLSSYKNLAIRIHDIPEEYYGREVYLVNILSEQGRLATDLDLLKHTDGVFIYTLLLNIS